MELCLMIEGQEGVTWPGWRALARAGEQAGIGGLCRSDHYVNLDGRDPSRPVLDAWATISALAATTSTLRLRDARLPSDLPAPLRLKAACMRAERAQHGVSRVMCQQLLHDDLDAVDLLGGELAPRVR